ncbi:MAG: hypothetical protein N2Z57_09500 [Oscillospiraceae bacterium]|nr:hypothetical protein [Oscillospiraceae bacterium]
MLIKGANAVGMIASGIKIADDVVDTAKTVKKISDAVQDVELASKSADKISDAGKSAAKVADGLEETAKAKIPRTGAEWNGYLKSKYGSVNVEWVTEL